jgi:hypothetical protein
MHIFPLAPTVWSNKSACAGARVMSAVISCVGQEGIATPSTARAGSKAKANNQNFSVFSRKCHTSWLTLKTSQQLANWSVNSPAF